MTRRYLLVVALAFFSCCLMGSHYAAFGVAQERGAVAAEMLDNLDPSPNARGQLSGTVLVVPPWTHSNFGVDQASTVEPESLARGYLELKYTLNSAQVAKAGATVYTWANGRREVIDSANADEWITSLKKRIGVYSKAIQSRGYRSLFTSYNVTINGQEAPTLVEQAGFEFIWSDGMSLHSGVIVENAVAIEYASNPELTLIGEVSGDVVELRHEAVGLLAQMGMPEDVIIWVRSEGKGRTYAMAYVSRAMANLQEGNCAKAVSDATEAVERDPHLTTAFSLRSQVRSSCPHARHRDGKQALEDAQRYCQLKASDPTDQWVCHALRASALAEYGDFAKAVSSATAALDGAPGEMQGEMRKRLELYKSGKPLRQQFEVSP